VQLGNEGEAVHEEAGGKEVTSEDLVRDALRKLI
jgi:hypothetical protein